MICLDIIDVDVIFENIFFFFSINSKLILHSLSISGQQVWIDSTDLGGGPCLYHKFTLIQNCRINGLFLSPSNYKTWKMYQMFRVRSNFKHCTKHSNKSRLNNNLKKKITLWIFKAVLSQIKKNSLNRKRSHILYTFQKADWTKNQL